MIIRNRPLLPIRSSEITPKSVFDNRRAILRAMGFGGMAVAESTQHAAAALMAEGQHLAAPPGLVAQRGPPHTPHDAAQQIVSPA